MPTCQQKQTILSFSIQPKQQKIIPPLQQPQNNKTNGLTASCDVIKITEIKEMKSHLKDAKTKLQEIMQKEGISLPEYTLIETHGEDHQQTFYVSCRLDKKNQITHGKGKSIRQAEQEAALMMLQQYEE